jgi:hypothetical protein
MKPLAVRLVLALPVWTCAVTAQENAVTVRATPYCDLAKAPQLFLGKRIRVRAIYRYGFEIQRLDPPMCCPERGAKVWVEIKPDLDDRSRRLLRKLPRGMGLALATFEGALEGGGPYGDGGYRLRFTVDKVEKLEATAKASADHEPAWVPRNCGTLGRREDRLPQDREVGPAFDHGTGPEPSRSQRDVE